MKGEETLEVVNEQGEVIGLDTRANIHKLGLLHKEIHVYFYTPEKELIFQHRAKDKDTYPDMLEATVGGHVEPGVSFEETALKETFEETGVTIDPNDLVLLETFQNKASMDVRTGTINNSYRREYAYLFTGKFEDLKVEEGKSQGFEKWSTQKVFNLTEEEKKRFIPTHVSQKYMDLYRKGLEKLNLE